MKFVKRIADPVHGTIALTELESLVIQTKSFQRLRNVKQLGLAYLVYPGADYSRFSHSLGACHLAGQILEALEKKDELSFWGVSDQIKNKQLLRVAALLHDVGHYPFSHTMEHAIQDYYYSSWMEKSEGKKGGKPIDHELVGKRLMDHDPEISKVLGEYGINSKSLSAIFRKEEGTESKLTNLVSADLDVDRLDYLQRTAHHTSLPYGNVDIRYLLSQVAVDNQHRFALSPKALRTAEHLLLGRYFDYLQVSFHKTVAALEWLLSDVIHYMLQAGLIKCSESEVVDMIENQNWQYFDDSFMLQKIRDLCSQTEDEVCKVKTLALLNRKSPALVADLEVVDNRGYEGDFDKFRKAVQSKIPEWAKWAGIPEPYWHLWSRKRTLTAIGNDRIDDPETTEKAEKAVRIMDSQSRISYPIIDYAPSLMRVLGNYELFALRIYVLIDELDATRQEIRKKIGHRIKQDVEHAAWK